MGSGIMWQSGGRLTGAEEEGKEGRKWQSSSGERVGSQHRDQDPSLSPGQWLSNSGRPQD